MYRVRREYLNKASELSASDTPPDEAREILWPLAQRLHAEFDRLTRKQMEKHLARLARPHRVRS